MNVSTLVLEPIHEHGRFTYDFIIDGKSLAKTREFRQYNLVGCLDVNNQDWSSNAANALRLMAPADTGAPTRCMLFVCSECGDLGCGAITAQVSRRENCYVWSDFRYENHDPAMTEDYAHIGPFFFLATAYESALAGIGALD
ncbi:MAG: hypothetical protein U0105_13715 [Candidatus Obscuribacterales bacterium]